LTPINSSDNGNLPEGGLAQGGSLLLVNGQTSPVSVVPDGTKPSTGLVATGEGWWLRLSGRSRADIPLGLTASGALILQSPQARTRAKSVQPVAQASGRGLKASSEVRFYILPETLIGALSTNDAGALQGDVPMPAGMAPGTYTLQMNALTPSGDVRSLSIGVLVRAAGNRERIVSSSDRVQFLKANAELAPAEKADLRVLARKVGPNAITIESWGYVQKSDSTANDKALSKSRAKAVASFLRSLGVRGKYVVRGLGAAGAKVQDRKVIVTVKYVKG
jgi:outer membrane protein OmpA-like peptidoglycan-associated protein